MVKRVLLYGTAGGVLLALLRYIEYQHLVRVYPTEVYGGLVALIFTVVGVYVGLRFTRPKETVVATRQAAVSRRMRRSRQGSRSAFPSSSRRVKR